MGRVKGGKNKIQSGITYPRKCDTCDYISNNPTMFHYHKKTHYSVDGKLCDYGCGQPALFVSTQEKYCCSKKYQLCPEAIREQKERVTEHWLRPGSDIRRENAEKIFRNAVHNRETVEKARKTKWEKWGLTTEEQWKEYRSYARSCRKLGQKWAKDNGYEIGQKTFHVDHIVSVMDGFKNKISPLILSHPYNLRILEAKKNSSKGCKSEMTIEELLEKIKNG